VIDTLRSLPQGIFWYPFLGFLLFSLGRALWSVRAAAGTRRKTHLPEKDHIGALSALVGRAVTDQFAEQELQRRCIGLLLQLHGYSGYSVENCRKYLEGETPVEVGIALAKHLERLNQHAPERGTSRGVLSNETETILQWVENLTEAEK